MRLEPALRSEYSTSPSIAKKLRRILRVVAHPPHLPTSAVSDLSKWPWAGRCCWVREEIPTLDRAGCEFARNPVLYTVEEPLRSIDRAGHHLGPVGFLSVVCCGFCPGCFKKCRPAISCPDLKQSLFCAKPFRRVRLQMRRILFVNFCSFGINYSRTLLCNSWHCTGRFKAKAPQ